MDCRAAHRSRHPTFILWFLDGSPGRNTQQRAGGLRRNKHICRRTVWSRLQIQTKTMNLSQNFTLEELTYSRIAVENGLENVPPPQALNALKNLAVCLLQPLRNRYGSAIAVTSGYRSETVNLLAGGVAHSQHTKGEAADCFIPEGPEKLLEVLKQSGLTFDQAIVYRHKKFLHLSYREGFNRHQILYK